MKNIISELSKPLTKEDVELRIGSVTEKGVSLLIYKTARTDINRLNAVCGTKWENVHYSDTKGNICCKIAIFDKEINQWVTREDVGTESYTEKEKGSYSDSFKRAGFRWGIGTELYNAPFIWIETKTRKKASGKGFEPVNFYTSNLKIEKYEVVNGKLYLKISNKGFVVFSNFGKDDVKQEKEINKQTISPENVNLLIEKIRNKKLMKKTVIDILKSYNINRLEDLPADKIGDFEKEIDNL